MLKLEDILFLNIFFFPVLKHFPTFGLWCFNCTVTSFAKISWSLSLSVGLHMTITVYFFLVTDDEIHWSQNFSASAFYIVPELISLADILRVKKNGCSRKTILHLKCSI